MSTRENIRLFATAPYYASILAEAVIFSILTLNNNFVIILHGKVLISTVRYMCGSRKFCQRGSKFDNVFLCFFFS